MNVEQLAYWLRGSVENRNFDNISLEEARLLLKSIQDHSALPFKKVTPELSRKDVDLNELVKQAAKKAIEPKDIKITPFPNLPRPYDYDRPNYWLGDRGLEMKPGVLYC